MESKPIVYFDIETTSADKDVAQITQLSAVAAHGRQEIGSFNQRILFDETNADPKALEIQGYMPEKWEDAVTPRIAAAKFSRFLEPYKCVRLVSKRTGRPFYVAQLAGYNAVAFDGPVLQRMYRDLGEFLPASLQILDVYQLVLWHYEMFPDYRPENTQLGTACKVFGVKLDDAHDALSDARATAQLTAAITHNLALAPF